MRKPAEPFYSLNVRVDAETDRRRRRLQKQLKVTSPQLMKEALKCLEASLESERQPQTAA